eukprot:TRINITY_DN637_c0_g1_i15.p1 TRINITY_DN637_c0_g1~~TRINITY_DN637_c0_g1_i15.p1  ORF type:complete len:687 (+),score=156.87 TRINITY_DN637_c0_g1_i15:46-2106(+)
MRALFIAALLHAVTADFTMSVGFTDDMVLQMEPEMSSIYGDAPLSSSQIEVSVNDGKSVVETVAATVFADSTWKATLKPKPMGGSYLITATCKSGCTGLNSTTSVLNLQRVTFGNVYFCSGQSNMALSIHYTFEIPEKTTEVLSGKYSNIRTFMYGSMGGAMPSYTPRYTTQVGHTNWYNISYSATIPEPTSGGHVHLNPFHTFSATCLNFGFALTDLLEKEGKPVPPIGLIQSAIGGTRIEQWIDNSTFVSCKNGTPAYNSNLYYGMVTPFVNTTVKGFLWYQGENNCGEVMGNSMTKVGYGCYQVAIVDLWRRMFSAAEGTTNKLAPFGIVSLASGGSEGHGQHMAHMRWSQTGNYGLLPNPAMPNTFLAHAFDLGDPWGQRNAYEQNCSKVDPATGKYGPNCLPWNNDAWDADLKYLYPAVKNNSAPFFMGGIHPRIKSPVGRRLALAYYNSILGGTGVFAGPTISGCQMSSDSIEVKFNKTLLRNDKIMVQDFNLTGVVESLSFMTCTGASPYANESVCACSGWNYVKCTARGAWPCANNQDTFWYCEEGPGWKPPVSVIEDSKKMIESDGNLQWVPERNNFETAWVATPLQPSTTGDSITIDLKQLNTTGGVFAIRYGWASHSTDTCCGANPDVAAGYLPCNPAACPLMAASALIPANPFFALLDAKSGKCECLAPQVCDE